jgi:hypothetical protein
MSAADSFDRDLSEFPLQDSLPSESAIPPKESSDQDWQTVDCPGAISVDALPRADANDSNDAIVNPDPVANSTVSQPKLDLSAELAQVKQENLELRDRATQLEQDFTQGQIEWQLETARLLHQVSESTPPEQAQAVQMQLTAAQEQLSRLFQELELSHQTAQRQQILVETLTKQLESGQERIAELERDCATTQQRYNEQIQQRLQAEASCRDLRIRLNRQQQHTLQFKVALEKCLEMPAPSSRSTTEVDLSHVLTSPFEPVTAESIGISQNSPVQPWSAPVNQPMSLKPSLSHLLQDDLQSLHASIASPPSEPQSDTQNAGELMNLIFPNSEPAEATIAAESNSFFDIQPLLETEAAAIAPDSNQMPPAGDLAGNPASDLVWQDLANLIDSPLASTEHPESLALNQELQALGLDGSEATAAPASGRSAPLQAAWQISGLATPSEEMQNSLRSTPLPLFTGSPSPVVYPLRSTKKRESLAAVELPSFPRKSQ